MIQAARKINSTRTEIKLPRKGNLDMPKNPSKEYSHSEAQAQADIANARKSEIYEVMKRIFASMYVLQAKAKRFRWNHDTPWNRTEAFANELKKEQDRLEAELDLLAGRISEMGFTVPGALLKISDLSHLQQNTSVPAESAIYHQLVTDNRTLCQLLESGIEVAWNSSDYPTTKLLRTILKLRQTSVQGFQTSLDELQGDEPNIELSLAGLASLTN